MQRVARALITPDELLDPALQQAAHVESLHEQERNRTQQDGETASLRDPCALLPFIAPDWVGYRHCHVEIDGRGDEPHYPPGGRF